MTTSIAQLGCPPDDQREVFIWIVSNRDGYPTDTNCVASMVLRAVSLIHPQGALPLGGTWLIRFRSLLVRLSSVPVHPVDSYDDLPPYCPLFIYPNLLVACFRVST